MVAVACTAVRIGARHVKHASTTEGGDTVGGLSCGSQLSPGRGSAEMISDRRSDANSEFWSRASARTCCQRPKRGNLGGSAYSAGLGVR